MARVYVSVGSNIERERHVRTGIGALHEKFGPLILSRVYESRAVGFDGDDFFNLAAAFDTELSVQAVARTLRDIERANGRDRRASRFCPRTLDLDLLLYGDAVLEEGEIKLPREEITRYAFVLGPLAEIAGEMRHPVLQRRFRELWDEFDRDGQPMRPVAWRPGAGA